MQHVPHSLFVILLFGSAFASQLRRWWTEVINMFLDHREAELVKAHPVCTDAIRTRETLWANSLLKADGHKFDPNSRVAPKFRFWLRIVIYLTKLVSYVLYVVKSCSKDFTGAGRCWNNSSFLYWKLLNSFTGHNILCNASVFTDAKQTHVDAAPASGTLLLSLGDAGQYLLCW